MQTLVQAADSLVSRFGGPATYTRIVEGPYDPTTGTSTTSTSNVTVTAVVLDLTLQSNGYSTKYGTLIQQGDKEAYVIPPPGGLVVNPATDTFTMQGKTWKIVSFKQINPNMNERMVYFLYLRE
jgi:hypothetical protein